MLPELIDPTQTRDLRIREPPYIQEAQINLIRNQDESAKAYAKTKTARRK